MNRPLIIAHRGASAVAPENTLAAFNRAIADGAEGIELDVRITKDGVPVVHHDGNLKRTSGSELLIRELTADVLAGMDVGSWFGSIAPGHWKDEYAKERIPTLASVLDHFRDFDGLIYVELKADEGEDLESMVGAVCNTIRDSARPSRVVVKSFRLAFIPQLRSICPGLRTAALFAPKIMTILRKEKYLVDLAVEFGADELSVHYSLATKKLMKKASKHRLPVTIWTVDHPRWLRRAIRLGVQNVITNNPSRLLVRRNELSVRSSAKLS
jgi:glycerophosphoryl diester phosphodiesterase